MIENEDDITASALRRHTRARPDVGPGWREDSSETLYYSAAWLDGETPNTDPRQLGGAIAGPGGPYGEADVVIDIQDSVLLDSVEVAIMGAVRGSVLDEKPICVLMLRGRINKTEDRAQVLFLLNEDGAAGIVTELLGLQSRAGWSDEFLARIDARLRDMPL